MLVLNIKKYQNQANKQTTNSNSFKGRIERKNTKAQKTSLATMNYIPKQIKQSSPTQIKIRTYLG